MRNPNATGHVAEWGIELQPFELYFVTTSTIKSTVLVDFTVASERTDPSTEDDLEGESPPLTKPDFWTIHFDGAFACQGVGAGAILTSPTGDKLYYAVQLNFRQLPSKVSNNLNTLAESV